MQDTFGSYQFCLGKVPNFSNKAIRGCMLPQVYQNIYTIILCICIYNTLCTCTIFYHVLFFLKSCNTFYITYTHNINYYMMKWLPVGTTSCSSCLQQLQLSSSLHFVSASLLAVSSITCRSTVNITIMV